MIYSFFYFILPHFLFYYRKKEIEKSRIEVMLANDEAIKRKKDAKLLEKKEVEDILLYQAMKDAELAKREEEEALIERQKKERQAHLLAQQERVQNNAGKLDELRARRAAEEKERLERQKEKNERIKRKEEMKMLIESRNSQAQEKAEKMRQLKELDKLELIEAMNHTKKMNEREEQERLVKIRNTEVFRSSLQKQIEDNERYKQNIKMNPDRHVHEELIREEARLKVIRDKMVSDLEAQGINPKYLTEMKNVDIGKILKR